MIAKIGRILATAVAIGVGLLVLLDFFIDTGISLFLIQWAGVVVAFALLIGVVNLLRVHLTKIQARQSGWTYSIVLIAAFAIALIWGRNGPESGGGRALFQYVLSPLESTLFALMAFFIASAAYRAFRIRSFETGLLVVFAMIVLLGQVPAGFQLWEDFPLVKEWVLRVPVLAGARGILLGVALGIIATGLRVLLGADRPYADAE
jgi:hypothetical protein